MLVCNPTQTRCKISLPSAAHLRSLPVRAARASVQTRAIFGSLFAKKQSTPKAVVDILEAVAGSKRGLDTTPAELKAIKAAFEELDAASESYPDPSGTWKLVWTTEKETMFILKNASWFGTAAGDVFQVIDTSNGTLQNVIEFPPDGAFIVDSGISWEVDQPQVDFKFSGAALKLPSRKITLPPVGKGWFRNVYIDGKYRFARDVRGDYLICERDGPPREFV